MRRAVLVGLLVGLLVVCVPGSATALSGSPPADTGTESVRYSAPVPLRVLRGFSVPAGPFGPGHRGVDLATVAGMPVLAAGDGTVTFAGSVAGRGVVVIAHRDGVRTEYEPVRVSVHRGDTVRRGSSIGVVSGAHRGCGSASCLHWGARRGAGRSGYLDPLLLLRPLGPVRLLPWRG